MIYNVKKRKLRKEKLLETKNTELESFKTKPSQLALINLDLLKKLTEYEFNFEEKDNEDNTCL